MIVREGYVAETHTVTTEDCYILEMHRIPRGKNDVPNDNISRPVVFLQHGLLCSSADWVMGSSDNSLGNYYILVSINFRSFSVQISLFNNFVCMYYSFCLFVF